MGDGGQRTKGSLPEGITGISNEGKNENKEKGQVVRGHPLTLIDRMLRKWLKHNFPPSAYLRY